MKTFEKRLHDETSEWVKEGLVTAAQRNAILTRHPEEAGGGRFVAILGGVGGCLLLAGVCLVISSNWEKLGDWVKIGGLVALLAGAYYTGWKLKITPGHHPKTGDAFFMLGAGLFMAGIALVSQIFHLNSRPASGVLLWWLGIVAVPWLVRSKGVQTVSLAAFLTWLGMEFTTPGGWLCINPNEANYQGEYRVIALLTGLALSVWLAGLALRNTRREDFASLHERWGALLVCAGLYALGFLRHRRNWSQGDDGLVLSPVALVGVLLVLAAWGAWRASRRDLLALGGWFLFALVPVAAVLANCNAGDGGWLWSAWAWTALFVLNVFMIRSSLATGREGGVNIGLAFIALNIVTRYFDLFGTMLEGGVFFLVTGVIVLGLGYYLERKRRGWVAALRAAKEIV